MFPCSLSPQDSDRAALSVEAIDDDLGNNDSKTHRQHDREGGHAVRDGCTQERQSGIRAIGKLQEAAGHPEEEDSRHQRNHRGKANGGEWHMTTMSNWSKNQSYD